MAGLFSDIIGGRNCSAFLVSSRNRDLKLCCSQMSNYKFTSVSGQQWQRIEWPFQFKREGTWKFKYVNVNSVNKTKVPAASSFSTFFPLSILPKGLHGHAVYLFCSCSIHLICRSTMKYRSYGQTSTIVADALNHVFVLLACHFLSIQLSFMQCYIPIDNTAAEQH